MPEKKPPSDIKRASRTRPLGDGEKALWDAVTKDVKALQRKRHDVAQMSAEEAVVTHSRAKTADKPKASDVHGWITLEMPLPLPAKAHKKSKSSSQVDASLKKKALQGDLPIDGKIDLHGMTLARAHQKFSSFLRGHIEQGSRFLLIVTGKGTLGEGVIRKSFPHWCEEIGFAHSILLAHHAAPKHGGSGAFYILLRRSAKKSQ